MKYGMITTTSTALSWLPLRPLRRKRRHGASSRGVILFLGPATPSLAPSATSACVCRTASPRSTPAWGLLGRSFSRALSSPRRAITTTTTRRRTRSRTSLSACSSQHPKLSKALPRLRVLQSQAVVVVVVLVVVVAAASLRLYLLLRHRHQYRPRKEQQQRPRHLSPPVISTINRMTHRCCVRSVRFRSPTPPPLHLLQEAVAAARRR